MTIKGAKVKRLARAATTHPTRLKKAASKEILLFTGFNRS
jgi:hypothetical protein